MVSPPRTILQVPLKSLSQECVLDISTYATPQRYRLINCDQFVQNEVLCIDEFADFPSVQYAAMSYVWKGNPLEPPEAQSCHRFSVAGALDGDPISIHVLSEACLAAVKHGASYIWLDRLCIMFTAGSIYAEYGNSDKNWQIQKMAEMYKRCDPCIILPGGVQKLVRIDEETAWIHRGWTLQELLMPQRALVLLSWKLGAGTLMAGKASGTVSEVTHNESAVMSAADVLNACDVGYLEFTSPDSSSPLLIRSCVFGAASPNLYAASVALSKVLASDPDAHNHAIWQSALMRTSSRPVDMVFSIMGLFDVILDPGMFQKEDRIGATVALAKEILRKGGRASWLGMSFRLPPCSMLCTFPVFPETSVSGKALVRTRMGLREAAEFVDGEYPNEQGLSAPLPGGTMDDDGYFTFSARAVLLRPTGELGPKTPYEAICRGLITSINGVVWKIDEYARSPAPVRKTYGVIMGWFQDYYPGASLGHDTRYIKGMVVREHAHEKFDILTFFSLHSRPNEWVKTVKRWQHRQFCVGGPKPLAHREPTGEETFDNSAEYCWLEGNNTSGKSERDIAARRARWAMSQVKAEDYLQLMQRRSTT